MGYSGHTKGPVINYVEGGYKKEKRVSKTCVPPPPPRQDKVKDRAWWFRSET